MGGWEKQRKNKRIELENYEMKGWYDEKETL